MNLRVYKILKKTRVEGPGIRFCIWVQGCSRHCSGCWAKHTWDKEKGSLIDIEEIYLEIKNQTEIEGVTFLGGEPFEPENQPEIVSFLRQVKEKYPEKTVWAFSGYLFDKDILAGKLGPWSVTGEYLSYLDVIVDGPFVQEKKDLSLRFRGSSNQRIIDVQASLRANEIVLWEDWQGHGRGVK